MSDEPEVTQPHGTAPTSVSRRLARRARRWKTLVLGRMAPPDHTNEDGSRVGFSRRKKLGLAGVAFGVLALWTLLAYIAIPAILSAAHYTGGTNAGF